MLRVVRTRKILGAVFHMEDVDIQLVFGRCNEIVVNKRLYKCNNGEDLCMFGIRDETVYPIIADLVYDISDGRVMLIDLDRPDGLVHPRYMLTPVSEYACDENDTIPRSKRLDAAFTKIQSLFQIHKEPFKWHKIQKLGTM